MRSSTATKTWAWRISPVGAVGGADSLAGVVDEQPLARRVGLSHRQRQLLAPAAVVLAECAVLEAIGLLGLVLLPQQLKRDALAAQLVMHRQLYGRRSLLRRRLTQREQPTLQGLVVDLRRQRVRQARQPGTPVLECCHRR